jgi:hypothetical protein
MTEPQQKSGVPIPAPSFPQAIPQVTPDGKVLVVQVILAPGISLQIALGEDTLHLWMKARKSAANSELAVIEHVRRTNIHD